jgi:hypothetical protein
MQQPQLITYAEIIEVRTVTGAAACNQLLAAGWVLLGVYPLTTVAEMTEGTAGNGQRWSGDAGLCRGQRIKDENVIYLLARFC